MTCHTPWFHSTSPTLNSIIDARSATLLLRRPLGARWSDTGFDRFDLYFMSNTSRCVYEIQLPTICSWTTGLDVSSCRFNLSRGWAFLSMPEYGLSNLSTWQSQPEYAPSSFWLPWCSVTLSLSCLQAQIPFWLSCDWDSPGIIFGSGPSSSYYTEFWNIFNRTTWGVCFLRSETYISQQQHILWVF